MNMDDKIARINELYHKSKAEGLTPEEKEEQARLRGEYIAAIRANMRAQLENTTVIRQDGTEVPLSRIRKPKNVH